MAAHDDLARQVWLRVTALFVGGENGERFPSIAAELGITPGQMHALLDLKGGDPLPMNALASKVACDASYATSLVDSLERAGYVERRVAPHDRRVKLVHLTDAGRAVQVRAVELLSRPPKRFADLTPAELHTLHRLLARVTDGVPFADRSASPP